MNAGNVCKQSLRGPAPHSPVLGQQASHGSHPESLNHGRVLCTVMRPRGAELQSQPRPQPLRKETAHSRRWFLKKAYSRTWNQRRIQTASRSQKRVWDPRRCHLRSRAPGNAFWKPLPLPRPAFTSTDHAGARVIRLLPSRPVALRHTVFSVFSPFRGLVLPGRLNHRPEVK